VGIDQKTNWVAQPRRRLSRQDVLFVSLMVAIAMVVMLAFFG
jgi:hypothetical protein